MQVKISQIYFIWIIHGKHIKCQYEAKMNGIKI